MINHGELHAIITPRGNIKAQISPKGQINVTVKERNGIENDYEKLKNLPAINGSTVIGDKNGNELGLINSGDSLGISEIDRMFEAVFGG